MQTEFCLLNEDHTGSSCGVGVGPDGVRKNLCKHAGCAMPWADMGKARGGRSTANRCAWMERFDGRNERWFGTNH